MTDSPLTGPEKLAKHHVLEAYCCGAADRWRLKRARNMENALFAQIEAEQSDATPAAAQAQAWVDPSKGFQRIAL